MEVEARKVGVMDGEVAVEVKGVVMVEVRSVTVDLMVEVEVVGMVVAAVEGDRTAVVVEEVVVAVAKTIMETTTQWEASGMLEMASSEELDQVCRRP